MVAAQQELELEPEPELELQSEPESERAPCSRSLSSRTLTLRAGYFLTLRSVRCLWAVCVVSAPCRCGKALPHALNTAQMSGPGCATYRIIRYTLVAADASGRECGTLSSMMQNDGPAITRHAYNVHHIDSTMLESHGVPSQLDGMRQLVEFLEEQGRHGPTVLVAHNGFACDFKYLHHTLKRLGLRLPATVAHFVDSLRLARGVEWAARPPNFKLGTLYHVATGAALADAHDALADARALARMFMGLPCLWTARQSQVHAWSKFLEVEDVRQAAKDAALAQPSRNALDDSDTESASPIDSDGDSDGDSGHDEAKEAGEWTPVADGAGMDRAPEDLFASGWATAGLKHAARFLDLAPSAMFLKLLEPVESLLVEETNRYAAQKRAARRIRHFLSWCVERRQRPFADLPFERLGMRRWKKVTRAEMRGCLAFVLRCSVHSTPGQVHWDTAACMKMSPAEYERAMIGRHRYEQIKRYLHASDSARQPASGSANYDPAYKVARLLQAAVKSWNKHYDPGPVVSIDETLLNVFKGRYRHRLKIRSKRHKTGIKLYVATGVRPNYVVAVRVKCADHDRSSGCFEGTKVVLQLMEDAGLLDQHRTVVTDNWYTSVEALKALKARSTFCYGVLRATRVPAAARFTEAEQRQPRGFSKTVYNSNLDAMVVGWMDNKPRYCLSNATSSKCNHEVGRRVKGVGATTVKAPDTLRRYNWDMGGVDWVRPCCGCCGCCARARDLTLHRVLLRQVDAITANVSVGANMVRTRKWWKKVLWYIIDTMVANANVLFNQFGERRAARSPDGAPFTRLSRREFVLQVLDELYSGAQAHVVEQSPPVRSHVPELHPELYSGTQAHIVEQSPPVRSHVPELHPKRARCWVCLASGASRLTKWKCSHPACPASLRMCHPQRSWAKRDCFQVFHRNPGRFKAKRKAPASFASPQRRQSRSAHR